MVHLHISSGTIWYFISGVGRGFEKLLMYLPIFFFVAFAIFLSIKPKTHHKASNIF